MGERPHFSHSLTTSLYNRDPVFFPKDLWLTPPFCLNTLALQADPGQPIRDSRGRQEPPGCGRRVAGAWLGLQSLLAVTHIWGFSKSDPNTPTLALTH